MTDRPPASDADGLMAALRLRPALGCICDTGDGWMVIIYADRPQPEMTEWAGRPIEYRIGGGIPQAFGAAHD
jgi:hypothetical protein